MLNFYLMSASRKVHGDWYGEQFRCQPIGKYMATGTGNSLLNEHK